MTIPLFTSPVEPAQALAYFNTLARAIPLADFKRSPDIMDAANQVARSMGKTNYTGALDPAALQDLLNNLINAVNVGSIVTGPWSPLSIVDGSLELWFDANNAGSFSLTGGNVNSWTDLVHGVVANAGTTEPIRTAGLLNGLPGVIFTATTNMLIATTTHAPFTGNVSCFIVLSTSAANLNRIPLRSYIAGLKSPSFIATDGSSQFIGIALPGVVGSDSTTQLAQSTPSLIEWIAPGTPANGSGSWGPVPIFVTGNAGVTIAAMGLLGNAFAQTGISISDDFSGDPFVGNIFEIVLLNTLASTVDRQLLEGYMAWRWGIQSQLPGGHPYKNAAP